MALPGNWLPQQRRSQANTWPALQHSSIFHLHCEVQLRSFKLRRVPKCVVLGEALLTELGRGFE